MLVIYDKTTGQIEQYVSGAQQSAEMYESQEIGVLEIEDGTPNAGFYVLDGILEKQATQPSPNHEWDWPTKSWLPNLDAARESQRQAWNAWRDREFNAGYVHEGHRFHTNEEFMGELLLLLKGHEEGLLTGTSSIRTMGNVVLQKTGAEIKTLLLILGIHRQAIYAQSWVGKDALASLTTLEDIMAGGPSS